MSSAAVVLPSAVGVSWSNWKYKSRALNEAFHKSAPGLQSVQQRIKISVCEGGTTQLVCNIRISRTNIGTMWFVKAENHRIPGRKDLKDHLGQPF